MGLGIDIPSGNGTGGVYKGINPGNYKAKINKLELWARDYYKPEESALFLVLKMETTKPSPDFVGYPIDENNPDGPKHDGLVGNIKYSTYAYKDGFNTRTNQQETRDSKILKDLLSLCMELGIVDWFKKYNNNLSTIEEWIEKFNQDKPAEGKYLEVCIAAEEYIAKDGKVKKTLYFPKSVQLDDVWYNPYKGLLNTKKHVIQYDENKHWKKATPAVVEGFKPEDIDIEEVQAIQAVDVEVDIDFTQSEDLKDFDI
jgi:hypothetical protein